MKVIDLEEVTSTIDYIKQFVPNRENVIVTAKKQTQGRGTKGRSFSSQLGGIYLTKLNFYDDFLAKDVFKIMIDSCVAICKTVESFGMTPSIKWPNDVYVNGKKICGILIENSFSGDNISYSIVGIGLNVNNDLPLELKEIATTMKQESKKILPIEEVREKEVFFLSKTYSLEEYKNYIGFLNRKVQLIFADKKVFAIAKEIDRQGRLIVQLDENIQTVTAAEVSLRF